MWNTGGVGVPEDFWEALLIDSKGHLARSRTMLIRLQKGESRFQRRMRSSAAAANGKLMLGRDVNFGFDHPRPGPPYRVGMYIMAIGADC